jgi:hypothetical protein
LKFLGLHFGPLLGGNITKPVALRNALCSDKCCAAQQFGLGAIPHFCHWHRRDKCRYEL